MKGLFVSFFIFLFALLSVFSSGVIDSTDGFIYLGIARNIYYKGEPTAPDYKYATKENIHMNVYTGSDRKTYSTTGIGFSLAFLPAVFITDMVYKIYNVTPVVNFPLENDWLILLTASFTNAFFGALLGTVMLVFFLRLGFKKIDAFILSLISIFATNLLPYAKHSMAHMMFISFLMLSFLFIKIYSQSKQSKNLFFAGLAFGVVMISYNQTFGLAILPLIIYYLLLIKPKLTKIHLLRTLKDTALFILGTIPFAAIYIWYENTRAVGSYNGARDLASVGITYLTYSLPVSVFIEGVYGQLFSPGRSVFVYTPLLALPVLFWHKIKKNFYPEVVIFVIYFAILVIFYSKAYSIGRPEQGVAALWHGESSWGPRYLTPIIPLAMLTVGAIYKTLKTKIRILIFLPFVLIGLYIQILGIVMPYQIKFAGLEASFYLNGTEYTSYVYSNLLPRYNPLLAQSRELVKKIREFPSTISTGPYFVNFFDGIDFSFPVGSEKWRVVEGRGYLSFNSPQNSPVKKISLNLINHPIESASHSASINFYLNNQKLLDKNDILKPAEQKTLDLNIDQSKLLTKNELIIDSSFLGLPKNPDDRDAPSPQILAIKSLKINDQPINLESISLPYVSSLGPKLAGVQYQNWGGINKDPWKTWHLHTQTFERLPDFWWIRNLYYWDIPRKLILTLFGLNIIILIYSGYKTIKILKQY